MGESFASDRDLPHALQQSLGVSSKAGGWLGADSPTLAALLWRWASTYIWWKTPDEALAYPERIIAQVMNIGDYGDVQRLVESLGTPCLRDLLRCAEAGWFNERSWHYWHYRLGLAQEPSEIPPLPTRRVE